MSYETLAERGLYDFVQIYINSGQFMGEIGCRKIDILETFRFR